MSRGGQRLIYCLPNISFTTIVLKYTARCFILKNIKYARAQDSTFSVWCFLRDTMMQWYNMNYKKPLIMLNWNMEYKRDEKEMN